MALKWKDYNKIKNEFEAYAETISMSIQCLIIVILIIIHIKYFCSTNNKIDGRFNILLLISLICAVIYVFWLYTFHIILPLMLGKRNKWLCFMSTLSALAALGQRTTIYSFFLIRLYDTFKTSVFEINKKYIIIILVLFFSTATPLVIFTCIAAYFADTPSCVDGKYYEQWAMSQIILYGIDIIISIVLSYVYIKRLRHLIKMINSGTDATNDKFLYIANKLTLLALATIITTFNTFLVAYLIGILGVSLSCFDIIINHTCVMLSFVVLDKSYKKYCCCCIRIQNKCYGINQNKNVIELAKEIKTNESSNTKTQT